jgi:hypothetical protein
VEPFVKRSIESAGLLSKIFGGKPPKLSQQVSSGGDCHGFKAICRNGVVAIHIHLLQVMVELLFLPAVNKGCRVLQVASKNCACLSPRFCFKKCSSRLST